MAAHLVQITVVYTTPVSRLNGGSKDQRLLPGQAARQQREQRQRLLRVLAQHLVLSELPWQLVPVQNARMQACVRLQSWPPNSSDPHMSAAGGSHAPSASVRTTEQLAPVVGGADSNVARAVQRQALQL